MTSSIKKILCAVDFSPASKNALYYALQLADAYQAELELLHVIEVLPDAMLEIPQAVPIVNQKLLEETRERLRRLAEHVLTEVSADLQNEAVLNTKVGIGPVALIVNAEAKDKEVDLILMGTAGEDAKPWWMGSVAKDVIDHPSLPVLIVPQDASYVPIDRISFATDLRNADLVHILQLLELLAPKVPEIRCMHVVSEEKKTTELQLDELVNVFSDQLKDINITFHESEEDDVTEALEAFALMYHIDLQVMVRPKRNFFGGLFHKSQSKKTAGYTHLPLLIWPG